MDLETLNRVCLAENEKQLVKLQDLTINEKYSICKATIVNTKYGRSILLHLESKVVFLPQRVTNTFEPQLNHFAEGKYALIFKGTKDVRKPHPLILFEICLA